jgi:hypothetical protein
VLTLPSVDESGNDQAIAFGQNDTENVEFGRSGNQIVFQELQCVYTYFMLCKLVCATKLTIDFGYN